MPTPSPLPTEATSFIDSFGTLISESGLPRSMGRVLGLLLICEPRQLTAAAIQQQLGLSSGSVSTATTFLERTGLIQRVTRAGSRRLYYEADAQCWQRVTQIRLQQITRGVQLANQGLALQPGNDRLLGMRHLYTEFERTLRQLKV